MNSDFPTDPRQALEVSLTAMLLGELPPDQSDFLRRAMALDSELAKTYERLRQTMELVRETEKAPVQQPAPIPERLKLSEERRQALLQHFKTVTPKEFEEKPSPSFRWLVPVGIAAVFVLLLGSMLLPALSRAKSKSSASFARRSPVSGEIDREKNSAEQSAAVHGFYEERLPALTTIAPPASEVPASPPPKVAIVLPSSDDQKNKGVQLFAGNGYGGFAKQEAPGASLDALTRDQSFTLGDKLSGAIVEEEGRTLNRTAPAQNAFPSGAFPSGGRMAASFYGGAARAPVNGPGAAGGIGGAATSSTAAGDYFGSAPQPGLANGDQSHAAPSRPTAGRTAASGVPPADQMSARYGLTRGATVQENSVPSKSKGEEATPASGQTFSDTVTGLTGAAGQPAVGGKPEIAKETELALTREWSGKDVQDSKSANTKQSLLEPRLVELKPSSELNKLSDAGLAQNESLGRADRELPTNYSYWPEKKEAVERYKAAGEKKDSDSRETLGYPGQTWSMNGSVRGFYDANEDGRVPILGDRPLLGKKMEGESVDFFAKTAPEAKKEKAARTLQEKQVETLRAMIVPEGAVADRGEQAKLSRKLNEPAEGRRARDLSRSEIVSKPHLYGRALEPSLQQQLRAGTTSTNFAVSEMKIGDKSRFLEGVESVAGFDWGAIAAASASNRGGGMLGGRGIGGGLSVPRATAAGGMGGGRQMDPATLKQVMRTNDAAANAVLLRQFFMSMGIDLNPPKSVFWNDRDGTLVVRATPKEIEQVRSAIQVLDAVPTADNPQATVKAPETDASTPKAAVPPPVPQPELDTRENAFSTFSLNVSDVSFKTAAASLEKGVMPEPGSIRSEEFINAFDYRDPEPAPGMPVGFSWDRARYPFAQNRDVLRFAIKTAAEGRQAGRPLNIVLLLDNSGSMERADRVRIIREALKVLAAQLQPQDKLSVVTFARTAQLRVDGIAGDQAGRQLDELSDLTPEGGTNLEEAMNLAYQTALKHYLANGINRIVLLTDGAANLGDVEPENLKKKVEDHRKQGIALDCFGIGWEGYNDDLLESLTRNGDGRYGFINSPEEAATEFAPQLAGALHVAASDVKVQVEFNPKRVTAWRQIGYAKHQLTKEQFRDNTVDAAEIAAAESGNALYVVEVTPAGEGPLATVRVRYKVSGTTDYHEHEWLVPFNGSAAALEQSSPALKLATSAAAFSEWLATSPYAAEVTTDALLKYISGVPELYGADARPKKLEWMIRQAASLGK